MADGFWEKKKERVGFPSTREWFSPQCSASPPPLWLATACPFPPSRPLSPSPVAASPSSGSSRPPPGAPSGSWDWSRGMEATRSGGRRRRSERKGAMGAWWWRRRAAQEMGGSSPRSSTRKRPRPTWPMPCQCCSAAPCRMLGMGWSPCTGGYCKCSNSVLLLVF